LQFCADFLRRGIATLFKDFYSAGNDKEGIPEQHQLEDMSTKETFRGWQVDSVKDSPDSSQRTPNFGKPLQDGEFQQGSDDSGEKLPHLEEYMNVVEGSTSYQWLLTRMQREDNLTTSEASTMHAVSAMLRKALNILPQIWLFSSRKSSPSSTMILQSSWDPLAFVFQEGYSEAPDEVAERAIVIIEGSSGDSEAMTCSEYMQRTWPLLGEDFLRLTKHVIRSTVGSRCLRKTIKLTAFCSLLTYAS
jgi:hypothetical protein